MKKPPRIQCTDERQVYENRFLSVRDDLVVFPDGSTGSYLRMEWRAPFSVAVLPVMQDGSYLLIQQYCYALATTMLQVPKGLGDLGLSPAETALQELLCETGCRPMELEYTGRFWSAPTVCATPIHTFRASGCVKAQQPVLEHSEVQGPPVVVSREVARNLAWQSSLEDLLTRVLVMMDLQDRPDRTLGSHGSTC